YRGTKKSNQLVGEHINMWSDFLTEHLAGEYSEIEKKQMALKMISQAVGAVLLSRMLKETELSGEIIDAATPTIV
ncbi:MAG: hypothetical protein AABY53_03625, partial [Bdellovibrionota bacterium]